MPESFLLCECSVSWIFCFVDILITVQCGQANNVLMIELRAYDIGYEHAKRESISKRVSTVPYPSVLRHAEKEKRRKGVSAVLQPKKKRHADKEESQIGVYSFLEYWRKTVRRLGELHV